jgi:hypothetical protein
MTNVTAIHARPAFDLNDPATLVLDLANPKSKEVLILVEAFEEAIKANIEANADLGPLPVITGWNEITPAIAINLLLRNPGGANRKVDPGTIFYYANQMASGKWKATGQPVLVDANGILMDSQHRLYACVISGTTFKTFVVTEIEPVPGLFAYIDNGRARTAATALQTAGLNGVSPVIVKVIKIGEEVSNGVYSPSAGLTKLPRLSPHDVLELVNKYPNARKAARSASSDWDEAVALLGDRKDIVAYLGMRITDLHGEEKADEFFEEISRPLAEHAAESPFHALHKLAEKDNRSEKAMKPRHMLAAMIKVFNAWYTQEPLGRRWTLLVDEEFPVITTGEQAEEAA